MPLSIVIPAHNESAVIDRCLATLLRDAKNVSPSDVEIIVVANGCKDDTAERARKHGPVVRVIETTVASKSNALNLGDKAATLFPRFFVDADIAVTLDALRASAALLESGKAMVSAPAAYFDTSASSWAVRAFYRVWETLPYVKVGLIGSGVYGLSEAGRRRFDSFPAITADDAFTRLNFRGNERMTATGHTFTVTAPRTVRMLVKIKTRAHFGNLELARRFPALMKNEDAVHGGSLARLARSPLWWPSLAIYVAVRFISRTMANRRLYFGDHAHWERDQSSRVAPSPTTTTESVA